ncbi:hypothetical protein TBLA_0A03820 [Henningerozyma blattae CBS 6284]|uniref:THO complex subunit HPR1 n=1 Tax=Henningerozyma blattae (strain ATCC 34711 / CBS 6284 / DSM 70876 / NBRC 10599 / NRRL Y-10934 / UCD 77-7) TaxID=1071380 RepID=I2GVM8_HENB6|nr:hypothetical protein TBLA_0A03820 [Tetrapisispora blattae CBS 6284]CCH58180.1 hypothetical protein TBLA_0A03820 [Tetrapisispora blattae CBS 6284]
MDEIVQNSVEYLLTSLKGVHDIPATFLKKPIGEDTYPTELLNLQWDGLMNVSSSSRDILINTIFNRALTDILTPINNDEDENENEDENEEDKAKAEKEEEEEKIVGEDDASDKDSSEGEVSTSTSDSKGIKENDDSSTSSNIANPQSKLDEVKNPISLQKFKLSALLLDLCFLSRSKRQNPSLWYRSFFQLFSTVVDLLIWPNELLQFWEYPQSRIEWFKLLGDPSSQLPLGTSNLSSYKSPLFNKLRHWNELLEKILLNTEFNTPNDYILLFKFKHFLSEILPLNEESNINKFSLISKSQDSGNVWNEHSIDKSKRTLSARDKFLDDYLFILDSCLTNPLGVVEDFLDGRHSDFENTLSSLINKTLSYEDEFYSGIKKHNTKILNANTTLNENYPIENEQNTNSDNNANITKIPNYMKQNATMTQNRNDFWKNLDDSLSFYANTFQPTWLDLSINNVENFYLQFTDYNNDFFRKQFILQVTFALTFIKEFLNSNDIQTFYKNIFKKEDLTERESILSELNEKNKDQIISFCNKIIELRVPQFYCSRDRKFYDILNSLLYSDNELLIQKMDGFKKFQKFKISEIENVPPTFNNNFAKFGFILLGNKNINNVWKLNFNIHDIKMDEQNNPSIVFNNLQTVWEQNKKSTEPQNSSYDDNNIVKQWQSLRSLRSEYLFNFKGLDEETGINGLFDSELVQASQNKKDDLIEKLKNKANESHVESLKTARLYMEDQNKKRKILEDQNSKDVENLPKKPKLDDSVTNDTITSTENEAVTDASSIGNSVSTIENLENAQVADKSNITEDSIMDNNNTVESTQN